MLKHHVPWLNPNCSQHFDGKSPTFSPPSLFKQIGQVAARQSPVKKSMGMRSAGVYPHMKTNKQIGTSCNVPRKKLWQMMGLSWWSNSTIGQFWSNSWGYKSNGFINSSQLVPESGWYHLERDEYSILTMKNIDGITPNYEPIFQYRVIMLQDIQLIGMYKVVPHPSYDFVYKSAELLVYLP